MSKNLNEIQLLSVGDISESRKISTLYVAEYQRGYKWGSYEILSLLNDIYEFKHDIYCLQPLVVHPMPEPGVFELIDGQQRCTTIFLVLSILKNQHQLFLEFPFKISYNTRQASAEFLKKIAEGGILASIKEVNTESIRSEWNIYSATCPEDDNIDNFHFFQAYHLIRNWLSTHNAEQLYNKLWNNTYFIWYPVKNLNEGSSVKQIFLNLNSGKIRLTSAELIKALFILDIDKGTGSFDIRQFKRNELAQEWDNIEKKLHQSELWYFVTNKNHENYETRIGILFDLKWKKPLEMADNYSYDRYVASPESLNWQEIKGIFNKIEEWYEDIFLFHRIGFLINIELLSLSELIQLSEGKTKSKFKDLIEDTIRVHVQKVLTREGRISLDSLDYKGGLANCRFILLLYNILSLETIFPGQRFPFHLYQTKNWTIEHIHPQNPRDLDSIEQLMDWLGDYRMRLQEDNLSQQGLDDIEFEAKDNIKITKALQEMVRDFIESVKDEVGLHKISNLALLDAETNSSIGNKKFTEKRSHILRTIKSPDQNKNAVFVPLCTLNNFLKSTTTNNESVQMNFWSGQDSEYYLRDIESLLKCYLPLKLTNENIHILETH